MATHPPKPSRFLRVAVTGHRPRPDRVLNADEVGRTCAWVFDGLAAGLARLQSPLFTSDPPILTLISPLAEGADQIAAEAMFEGPADKLVHRRLEVVLPFGLEDYARTFEDPKAVARLRDWVEKAESRLIMADWTPPTDEKDSLASHWRDGRFMTLGSMLLDQADLLIAIWNGEPGRGRGGAADVIAEAVLRRVPVIWIEPIEGRARLLAVPDAYHDIFQLARREGQALSQAELDRVVTTLLSPEMIVGAPPPAGERALAQYLTQETIPSSTGWTLYQNLFVANARRALARKSSQQEHPKTPIWATRLACDALTRDLADEDWEGYPKTDQKNAFLQARATLSAAWTAADAISTRLGHIYRSHYILIFTLGALAVATGLLALVIDQHALFAGAEFVILLAGYGLYRSGRRHAHHQRLIASREISEQVRAHWGASLLGLAGRRALGPGAPWTAWLFNAYVAPAGPPNLVASPAALRVVAIAVREGVVRAQQNYHQNNASRLSQIHHGLEQLGVKVLVTALLVSGLLTAVTLTMVLVGVEDLKVGSPLDLLEKVMMVLNGALPALGAALAGLRFQGDFERFADRSRETSQALAQLDEALARLIADADRPTALACTEAPLFEQLRGMVLRLRDILLSDVEDWRFVYVARPAPEPG